jgi:hypothetical protein
METLRNTVISLRDSARKCAESLEHQELPDPADTHTLIHAIQDSEGVVPPQGLQTTLRHGHDHAHDTGHAARDHDHHAHEPSSCAEQAGAPSHTHDHHGATPEEQTIITAFLAACDALAQERASAKFRLLYRDEGSVLRPAESLALRIFLDLINKVSGVVDLYEHNADFKKACDDLGIEIRAGRYAARAWKHAYIIKASEEPGDVYSIWTDLDLDEFNTNLAVKYTNLDLFQGE